MNSGRRAELETPMALELIRRYEPKPYSGPAHLFRAEALLPHVRNAAPPPPELEWARLALGGLTVRLMPGDHFAMVTNPTARALAYEIETILGA